MARLSRAVPAALAAVLIASSALAEGAPAPAALPAALPAIDGAGQRAAADRARDELVAARARVDRANAAYAEMRSRDYPRGDARAAIVRERDDARAEYLRASARYSELVEQTDQGE